MLIFEKYKIGCSVQMHIRSSNSKQLLLPLSSPHCCQEVLGVASHLPGEVAETPRGSHASGIAAATGKGQTKRRERASKPEEVDAPQDVEMPEENDGFASAMADSSKPQIWTCPLAKVHDVDWCAELSRGRGGSREEGEEKEEDDEEEGEEKEEEEEEEETWGER